MHGIEINCALRLTAIRWPLSHLVPSLYELDCNPQACLYVISELYKSKCPLVQVLYLQQEA